MERDLESVYLRGISRRVVRGLGANYLRCIFPRRQKKEGGTVRVSSSPLRRLSNGSTSAVQHLSSAAPLQRGDVRLTNDRR